MSLNLGRCWARLTGRYVARLPGQNVAGSPGWNAAGYLPGDVVVVEERFPHNITHYALGVSPKLRSLSWGFPPARPPPFSRPYVGASQRLKLTLRGHFLTKKIDPPGSCVQFASKLLLRRWLILSFTVFAEFFFNRSYSSPVSRSRVYAESLVNATFAGLLVYAKCVQAASKTNPPP